MGSCLRRIVSGAEGVTKYWIENFFSDPQDVGLGPYTKPNSIIR